MLDLMDVELVGLRKRWRSADNLFDSNANFYSKIGIILLNKYEAF